MHKTSFIFTTYVISCHVSLMLTPSSKALPNIFNGLIML